MHLTPLLRNYCFFGVSPIFLTQYPVMLRDTAGEKGKCRFLSFINIQVYPHEFSTEPIFIHSPAQMSSVRGCVYWDFILAYCIKEPIRV